MPTWNKSQLTSVKSHSKAHLLTSTSADDNLPVYSLNIVKEEPVMCLTGWMSHEGQEPLHSLHPRAYSIFFKLGWINSAQEHFVVSQVFICKNDQKRKALSPEAT